MKTTLTIISIILATIFIIPMAYADYLYTADTNTTDGYVAINSVNGQNGTLSIGYQNVTNGEIGQAYNLTNGEYLGTSMNISEATNGLCAAFWYMPDSTNTGQNDVLFTTGSSGVGSTAFFMWYNGGQGKLFGTHNSFFPNADYPAPLPGQWTHFAISYNFTNIVIYANGSVIASLGDNDALPSDTEAYFGAPVPGYGVDSRGSFDAMHIFNESCNDAIIAEIFSTENAGEYFFFSSNVSINYTLTITANDTNTSNPVMSFSVTINNVTVNTTNGTATFTLENGSYVASISSVGYDAITPTIIVAGDTNYTASITPTAPPIPPSSSGALTVVIALFAIAILTAGIMYPLVKDNDNGRYILMGIIGFIAVIIIVVMLTLL